MNAAFRARLEQVYAAHPVNAQAVLERVRQERGTLSDVTARHLAESTTGGPTDQNHVGGAATVRELAAAVQVQPGWAVLDIGAGLGGTLRLFADEFGCSGHGVELTYGRYIDAVRLTQLTGLDRRVTFSHGDFMSVEIPGGPFQLAIAQGALMHFEDVTGALQRIAVCLAPDGRLAIEDGVILGTRWSADDSAALAELLHHWNGTFPHRDDWPGLLDIAGFRLDRVDDLTRIAVHEFQGFLTAAAAGHLTDVTGDERRGWDLALQLLQSGHLAIVRVVATRERTGG